MSTLQHYVLTKARAILSLFKKYSTPKQEPNTTDAVLEHIKELHVLHFLRLKAPPWV